MGFCLTFSSLFVFDRALKDPNLYFKCLPLFCFLFLLGPPTWSSVPVACDHTEVEVRVTEAGAQVC